MSTNDTTIEPGSKSDGSAAPGSRFTPSRAWKVADFFVQYGVYVSLVVAFAVFSILYPDRFLTHTNLIQGIANPVAVTVILGVGLTIALSCGQIDISGGALMTLLSITFVGLVTHANRGQELFEARTTIFVAILAVFTIALAVAALNGILVVDLGIFSLLATFPVSLLVYGITGVLGDPHGTSFYLLPDSQEWNFVYYANHEILGVPFSVYLAACVVIGGWLLLERTRFGDHVQSVGGNPDASLRAGIRVTRIYRYAFGITAFTTVLATYVAVGATATGGPEVGVAVGGSGPGVLGGASLDALTAVLLGGAAIQGGAARVERTVVGAFFVAIVGDGLRLSGINIYYQGVVTGIVFVLALTVSSLATKLRER